MDATVVLAIVGALATPVAVVITWMLNRKKHIAEIYEAISGSSQTAVETMQMTMNELRLELEKNREELQQARVEIKALISENELLREDLHALKIQNETLMEQIHDMRVSYEQSSQRDNLNNESRTS
jgi:uncharacterized protein (DUF3084 family)